MKKLNNHIKNISHKTANLPLYWFIPLILLLSYIAGTIITWTVTKITKSNKYS